MSDSPAEGAVRSAPNLRKSERTRQAILDGALEFLWSRPFREMTVKELMSIVGASGPAFYQYFESLHDLMETLLKGLEDDIFGVTDPWFGSEGDPVASLQRSQAGLVRVVFDRGPILRAVADAAPADERLERTWARFLAAFDDAVAARIEQDQEKGLIPVFDAWPVAVALNRLDVSLLIHAFGRRPLSDPEPVREALTRIWTSTLYGSKTGERKKRTTSSPDLDPGEDAETGKEPPVITSL